MSKQANIRSQALREAIHLQEMEDNPLTAEEVAMFEMFEREGWSAEKRREYILSQIDLDPSVDAAE